MIHRMNFLKFLVMSLFIFLFSPLIFADTPSDMQSVAGYWQTFDGKTKKPSSIIHIQSQGQYFSGKIVKIFSVEPEKRIAVCTLCRGDQKNKPILGLTIINNMVCESTSCAKGTILDPRDGKIYHATMRLVNNGQQLKVRGYVGMPMFGKTVIWQRTTAKAANEKI